MHTSSSQEVHIALAISKCLNGSAVLAHVRPNLSDRAFAACAAISVLPRPVFTKDN